MFMFIFLFPFQNKFFTQQTLLVGVEYKFYQNLKSAVFVALLD